MSFPDNGDVAVNLFNSPMKVDSGETGHIECFKITGTSHTILLRGQILMSWVDCVFDTFIPSNIPQADEDLLSQLDCLINPSLSSAEFCQVFIQCDRCKAMTARRNAYFHSCAAILGSDTPMLDDGVSRLFAKEVEGLKSETFEALFSACKICRKYMTRRMSIIHDCVFEARYKAALTPMTSVE